MPFFCLFVCYKLILYANVEYLLTPYFGPIVQQGKCSNMSDAIYNGILWRGKTLGIHHFVVDIDVHFQEKKNLGLLSFTSQLF